MAVTEWVRMFQRQVFLQSKVVKRRSLPLPLAELVECYGIAVSKDPILPGEPRQWKALPRDRTILCWWCRCYHLSSEVEACMALPRRTASSESATSSTSSVLHPGMWTPFSELWAFLTAPVYPDGTKRKTGRISLSCESGKLRGSLTDDETGQYASLANSCLDDLLLAFEEGLASGTLPWRDSQFSRRTKK